MSDDYDRQRSEAYLMGLVTSFLRTTDVDELHGLREELSRRAARALDRVLAGGFSAPPLARAYYESTLGLFTDSVSAQAFVSLVLALERDVTELLHDQVAVRRASGANVVFEWVGPTGFGKSSCMFAFMERHNRLADVVAAGGTAGLRTRIAVDARELPAMLGRCARGDAVAMDEQLILSGEGAKTAELLLQNLEETVRGSGIDLHWASPTTREHTTAQAVVRAVAMSAERRETRFLVSVVMTDDPEPRLIGYATLPWASDATWEAYGPMKVESLERSKRFAFNASTGTLNADITRFFELPAVQARFRALTPKQGDVARWWRQTMGASATAESDSAAGVVMEMMRVIERKPTEFKLIFGMDPTPAMTAAVEGDGERAF